MSYKEQIEEGYVDRLIKLSQMVSDNRLSSTNAKIVFEEINNWYRRCRELEGLING